MHILCPICSDLVNQAENIYVTKCGHIFHHQCLAQWIERSKSCPQCRCKVTDKCMFRLFPTISNETTGADAATLQSRLDDLTLQLRQNKEACREKTDRITALCSDLQKKDDLIKSHEKRLIVRDAANRTLKDQLQDLMAKNLDMQNLKAENEDLKKNIQMLNGLQKVLFATAEEVEQMLQGYSDLKTVATFATALKRALCESESKKSVSRDQLTAAKRQIAQEKSIAADLQARLIQLEDKLAHSEREYASLKKRKATEIHNEPCPAKHPRLEDSSGADDSAMEVENCDSSLNTMVKRIENAESPYLSLKQSSLALSALQRAPISVPTGNLKPSEFAMINAARNAILKQSRSQHNTSIFDKKHPLKPGPGSKPACVDLTLAYDGLGGHSRPDTFPVPLNKAKNCIPRVTAKHKLKRPTPAASQDIGKFLGKISRN